MEKQKYNYAVVKSIFNNLWIGKTRLKPERDKIFTNIENAVTHAEQLFKDYHPDFCTDEDDNRYEHNDYDSQTEWEGIEEAQFKEINDMDLVKKSFKKFIV